jgi:D-alanyl-D-alanine carboxypeptidase/D-alanyl-D-alanine-endopeptidase (penicillin-binding protein 4)
MSPTLRRAAVVLLLLLARPAGADEPTLTSRLEAVLTRPQYKHARWGVLVVEADSGKAVYERNAEQLFAPASVTKLYSCAAARASQGADYRFETPVHQRGKVTDGKLDGDLILVAKGDLTLGGRTLHDGTMAFADEDHIYATPVKTTTRLTETDPLAGLKDLAKQVKAAGIRHVGGDVLIDTRLFDTARGSGSGPGIVTPILVNDNIIDVTITPGQAPGQPATYELRPKTDYAQVDVQVETGEKKERTSIETRRVGPGRWTVRGKIAEGASPQVRICAVDDPSGFARALLIEALRREGVAVPASVLRPPTAELPDSGSYSKLPCVAKYRSPTLAEALKVTLKVSHNLYASTLPLLLAVKSGKRKLEDGMRLQGKSLAGLGVDVEGISLESGAGGGDGDKVSPQATVQLLQAMRKRADWPVFEAALPILGVDGTLATVVKKDSPARGKVKGKTGTYGDNNLLMGRGHLRAKSLAGVMTTAGGKTLVFAIFVNDVPLPRGATSGLREGRVIGELCEILQQHTP